MLLTALLAGMLTADAAACSAEALLTIPLESSRSDYRAAVAGYKLAVFKDALGWQVEVYALGDRRMRDNLLAPHRNWHGAFPFQVQPGTEAVFWEPKAHPGARHSGTRLHPFGRPAGRGGEVRPRLARGRLGEVSNSVSGPPNNEMKLTQPATARMARSSQLILVFGGPRNDRWGPSA